MLSEGQRNDINYAIPLLEQVDIKESDILADRGYDSNKLMDYIYAHGGEPTIPSRKGAKFDRYCDWHLYKERHLVENYFLKLKAFRRIATRYDKLASTFAAFYMHRLNINLVKMNNLKCFQTRSRACLKKSFTQSLHVPICIIFCASFS